MASLNIKWWCVGDSSERFFLQSADLVKLLRLEWREWRAGAREYKAGQEVSVKAVASDTSTHGGSELWMPFCDFVTYFCTVLWWQITFSAVNYCRIWMKLVSLYLSFAIGSIAAQYEEDGWVDHMKIAYRNILRDFLTAALLIWLRTRLTMLKWLWR